MGRAGAGIKANYQQILVKVQEEDDEEIEAVKRDSKEGKKGADDPDGKVDEEEEEEDVCTFSQIVSGNFRTGNMEIKETSRKRQSEEKGSEELRQQNKQLRKLVMRQQAQLSSLKPEYGAGGSGMQVSHPASSVVNNGWGQHELHKSDSSWLQPNPTCVSV